MKIYNKLSTKGFRKLLRNRMTKAEVLVWSKLKGKQIQGYKFRRQFAIDSYIVDFYCPELRLAIEIDGESHEGKRLEVVDPKRQSDIEAHGIKVIRFANEDVYNNLDGIIQSVWNLVEEISKQKIDLP